MKILEIVHRFPPAIGGSEKVVYQLSKQFQRQGHEVTIVTSTSLNNRDTRGFSTEGFFHFRKRNRPDYKEEVEGILVCRFQPSFSFFPYSFNPGMKKFLKQNAKKYDIIHVHGYQSYEADIVSRRGQPYILTAHDIVAHYGGILKLLKKCYDVIIGKRILKRARYLIALTPENRKQYQEIIPCEEKIVLIPNGIEPLTRREKKVNILHQFGNPKRMILFMGRVVQYKGIQDIIRALPLIQKEEPSTILVVAGEDQGYTKELQQIAREIKVEKSCFFVGKVSHLEDYYALADVFVLPSRGEGFGLVAVEAMSLGIPAVLANQGGLKYILQTIGGYPLDMTKDVPSQIAQQVLAIFNDKDISQKMKRTMEKTKPFNWGSISKRTLELFAQ